MNRAVAGPTASLRAWVLLLLLPGIGAAAAPPAVDPEAVRKVHLVFSNHFDAGFADYASNILNRYIMGGPGTLGPPHPRNETVQYDSFLPREWKHCGWGAGPVAAVHAMQHGAWWRVDLGRDWNVSFVRVRPRADGSLATARAVDALLLAHGRDEGVVLGVEAPRAVIAKLAAHLRRSARRASSQGR